MRYYSLMSLGISKRLIPSNTWSNLLWDSVPIFSTKSCLSTVNICVILTTLAFDKFASPFSSNTLPGDFALSKLDVNEQTTTVFIRLLLNTLFCITRCGCRYAGSEPDGEPRSTQKISPWLITTAHSPVVGVWISFWHWHWLQRSQEYHRTLRW